MHSYQPQCGETHYLMFHIYPYSTKIRPRPNLLASVDDLSGDENIAPTAQSPLKICGKCRRRPARRKPQKVKHVPTRVEPVRLRNLIQSKCGCQCDCFQPFRSPAQFDSWLKLRKMLHDMTKLEQDAYVRISMSIRSQSNT